MSKVHVFSLLWAPCLLVQACAHHVRLAAPEADAPGKERLAAFQQLQPTEIHGTVRVGGGVGYEKTTDFLILADGTSIYYAEDLLPLVPPASQAASAIERHIPRRQAAQATTYAGYALTVAAAGTLLPYFLQDRDVRPASNALLYVGVVTGVAAVASSVVGMVLRKLANHAKDEAFSAYHAGLQQRLQICGDHERWHPCEALNPPKVVEPRNPKRRPAPKKVSAELWHRYEQRKATIIEADTPAPSGFRYGIATPREWYLVLKDRRVSHLQFAEALADVSGEPVQDEIYLAYHPPFRQLKGLLIPGYIVGGIAAGLGTFWTAVNYRQGFGIGPGLLLGGGFILGGTVAYHMTSTRALRKHDPFYSREEAERLVERYNRYILEQLAEELKVQPPPRAPSLDANHMPPDADAALAVRKHVHQRSFWMNMGLLALSCGISF